MGAKWVYINPLRNALNHIAPPVGVSLKQIHKVPPVHLYTCIPNWFPHLHNPATVT